MTTTLGHALINSVLPKEHQISGPVTKKDLRKALVAYARTDPAGYARDIPKLKAIGDEVATYEGLSVGLDDISPMYKERAPILADARSKVKNAKNDKEVSAALVETQNKLLDMTRSHPGDLGIMARSGGRGDMSQLMKTVSSPGVIGDYHGKAIPYLIERGYGEGLSPAEAWIAGAESRGQVIRGQLETADPGELGKLMSTMMSGQVIAATDCGTKNGIMMSPNDSSILGRYVAGTNTLINSREQSAFIKNGRQLKVRSPMTCELHQGICQKCRGVEPNGKLPEIGTNVGIKSGQALAEPITQMTLSAKHGASLVEGADESIPVGVKAVRQFLEVPTSFMSKATLAKATGTISGVDKAPQGGHNITIGTITHYVPPTRKVIVGKGDKVEAGDTLSSGVPNPAEIVAHKGLGAGRMYLVNSFSKVYEDAGKSVDKRHLETLAKSQLNYVKLRNGIGDFLPGEVVPYNQFAGMLKDTAENVSVAKAQGRILAEPTLQHLPGTRVSNSMIADFKQAGIHKVGVTDTDVEADAIMTSASRTPLLNPNWMERLSHRYQKDTLLDAAQYGEKSDLHGYNPYSAIAFGKELRKGPQGTY